MKKSVAILYLLIGSLGFVDAQSEEFIKTAKETMELQNTKGVLIETFRIQFQSLIESGGMQQVDDIRAMAEEMADALIDKVAEAQLKLYYENYTLDELKELNKYLAVPIVQKHNRLSSTFEGEGSKIVKEPEVKQTLQHILLSHMARHAPVKVKVREDFKIQ